MILNEIVSVLKKSNKILILPHVSVDGDGLGSSLALALALKKMSKEVNVYLEEEIPYVYNFLPGAHMAEVYSGQKTEADAVVVLDTGDLGRLGRRAELLDNSRVTINIDHHNTNSGFALYNFVQAASSSVGEIVYQLIRMAGLDIDADISTCLYVAIATDTGGFRYANTTSLTHQITADLINNGVNVADVSQRVFDSVSLEKVRLMGSAISSLEILEAGKVALITVTEDMIKAAGAKEEDCDGLVNIGRNIRGVEVAALLRQTDAGEVRVNLRSNAYVDVSAIASLYSGGGHKKAAGCTIKGDIEAVRPKILETIRKGLKGD